MDAVKLDPAGLVSRCGTCGQNNRLRFESLDKGTRCGRCRADIVRPGVPLDIPSADAFTAMTGKSALPVLVDFWAEWCGPCRMVAPELVKLAASHAREFLVAKLDTEALPDLAGRLGIQSIPTMALYYGGRELARTAGARPAAGILSFVEQALAQQTR